MRHRGGSPTYYVLNIANSINENLYKYGILDGSLICYLYYMKTNLGMVKISLFTNRSFVLWVNRAIDLDNIFYPLKT